MSQREFLFEYAIDLLEAGTSNERRQDASGRKAEKSKHELDIPIYATARACLDIIAMKNITKFKCE